MKFTNTPHYYNALIIKLKTLDEYSIKCSKYGFLTISCRYEDFKLIQTFCDNLGIQPDDYGIQSLNLKS